MPFISASVISPYNSIRGGAEGGLVPGELLLDLYPNATAAYSLGKLRTAYSGPAIEAIKIVGDETFVQNIGFVDNELDTASLLTFANGGDVFVAKWYDQSNGGNNDALQVSDAFQPQIVSSGSVINELNGKPALQFGNGGMATANPVDLGGATELWFFMVINITDVSTTQIIYETSVNNAQNNNSIQISLGASRLSIVSKSSSNRTILSVNSPPLGTSLISIRFRGGQTNLDAGDVYINGVQQSLIILSPGTSPETFGNYNHYLGARNNSSLPFLGDIQFVDIMTSDQSANRASIESIINNYCNVYWDGSQTGLLDDYPNASAAYSLRALNSAYTGPAIEAMKTVGDETFVQNIGFLYDGSLDTASLLSFAGSDDVFVAKWYDQSGSNDVAQVSESAQPQIVSSGIVNTTSGNYAIDFSGATKNLVNETFDNSTQVSSVFTVAKSTSSVSQVIIDGVNLASRQVPGYYAGAPSVFAIHKGVTIKSAVPINTNLNLLSTFFDVNSDLYLNGDKILDSVNAGNYTREGFILGSGIGLAAPFEGSIFEIIVFDEQNKSSDRVGIETNINNHYTIYP